MNIAPTLTHLLLLLGLWVALTPSAFSQGSLTPPGAPAPTMKSLDQLDEKLSQATTKLEQVQAKQNVADAKAEKRTPISSLPFTINSPGSYYLTGNLTSNSASANGITVTVSDVTVDLMGFLLRNSVATAGNGIHSGDTIRNVTVRNGSVSGWASGIALAARNVRVERVSARANTVSGISAGAASVVIDCAADLNGGTGISLDSDGAVVRCVARENSGNGIRTFAGGLISHCVSKDNERDGITMGSNGSVQECAAIENGADGIEAANGALIVRCTAQLNAANGIRLSGGAGFALENSCRGNGFGGDGAGILASASDNRLEGNHVLSNDRGIDVNSAGNLIIRNSASGNTTADYDFVANNVFGQIVDRRTPSSAAVNTTTTPNVASSAGTTDPWANFVY